MRTEWRQVDGGCTVRIFARGTRVGDGACAVRFRAVCEGPRASCCSCWQECCSHSRSSPTGRGAPSSTARRSASAPSRRSTRSRSAASWPSASPSSSCSPATSRRTASGPAWRSRSRPRSTPTRFRSIFRSAVEQTHESILAGGGGSEGLNLADSFAILTSGLAPADDQTEVQGKDGLNNSLTDVTEQFDELGIWELDDTIETLAIVFFVGSILAAHRRHPRRARPAAGARVGSAWPSSPAACRSWCCSSWRAGSSAGRSADAELSGAIDNALGPRHRRPPGDRPLGRGVRHHRRRGGDGHGAAVHPARGVARRTGLVRPPAGDDLGHGPPRGDRALLSAWCSCRTHSATSRP